jgi:hypothetical protein
MGAGGRRDAIDTHMFYWNMDKKHGLGTLASSCHFLLIVSSGRRLEDKYYIAKTEVEDRTVIFQELEDVLDEYRPGLVQQYREEYTRRGGEQFRPDKDKVKCVLFYSQSKMALMITK